MTSSSHSSQSTRPTGRELWKELLVLLDFTRNYKWTSGIFVPYSYPLNLPYVIFPDANTVYTETVTMPTNHTRHMIEVTTNSSACLLYTTHSSFCRKCLTRNHLHERFVYRFLKILFCPQWVSAEFSFHSINNNNHLHERFVYLFLKILFCRQWLSAKLSFHHPSTIKKTSPMVTQTIYGPAHRRGHLKRRPKIVF